MNEQAESRDNRINPLPVEITNQILSAEAAELI